MAKPKLALIPSAQGSKFYSVLPSSGVGDFNFTRSGSATRINSQGLIESVANGVSRLNYPMIDGFVKGCPHHILEPQRLQQIQYSEDFSQSYWTKSGLLATTSVQLSPDGTNNAFKLVEDTSTGIHQLTRSITNTVANQYSISVFVKENTRNWIRLSSGDGGYVFFNISDNTIGIQTNAVGVIEDIGNGWKRCKITFTAAGTNGSATLRIAESDGVVSYVGQNKSVYVYGMQYEQGSYATSYIPNYGTALSVTRSAETATGSGDAATFNDSEGVLMAEISALADDDVNRYITISDGTTSNRVALRIDTDNKIGGFVTSGTSQASFRYEINTLNFSKVAIKYKTNDFSLFVNGFEVFTDFVGSTPSGLNVMKYKNSISGDDFYGKTKQLQYFDTALTDSELEQLTSWVSFQEMAEGQLYTIE